MSKQRKLLNIVLSIVICVLVCGGKQEIQAGNDEFTDLSIRSQEYPDYVYDKLSNGKIQVTEYLGIETIVQIPETMDGFEVYALGSVFKGNSTVKEVVIADSVTSIGAYCFQECVSLKKVQLPEGLKTIGRWAFDDSGLEEIQFPDKLERIGDVAFYGCENLKSVVIPDNVREIGSYAFSDCTALEEVDFRGVQTIGARVFEGCNALNKVTFPKGVYKVAEDIFDDASKVTIYGFAGTYAETYANKVGAAFVDVSVHVTDVQLEPEELSMFVKEVKSLTAIISPVECTDEVIWVSSDNNVATVSETGEVVSHQAGTATITLKVGEFTKTCMITVIQPITSLSFELDDVYIKVGETKGNFVFKEPDDATNPEVEFSSSNTGVALVDEIGTIYAVREGNATITVFAMDGSGMTADCHVFVSQADIKEVFNDVKESDWWYSAVQYVYYNDIMVGTDGEYDPTGKLTREQFVQVLYNNSGKPGVSIANEFPDVKNAWYKNAVLWANENNIANGYKNGEFGVGDYITRQDLALMLYKYATLNGFDLTATEGLIEQYADGAKVSQYAQNAMNWAVTQEIMSGKGVKGEDISTFCLDPYGEATRAECASMIMKLMEKNN